MKIAHYTILFILICSGFNIISSQNPDTLLQLPSLDLEDKGQSMLDTIPPDDIQEIPIDSTGDMDVFGQKEKVDSEEIEFSNEPLEEIITYGAKDTQWYDHKNKLMHLFGEAYVNYDGMDLKAGYIILDIENNIAEAQSIESDQGEEVQAPTFNDGTKEITYRHLKYNFETKKGIVYDAISTEGDLFLHGARTKFVSGEEESDHKDDVIYNANTLITSCSHEHPHFGFRTKKLKIIPDKIAVIGPANLELGGVPTPFFIPYGFFPLVSNKSTGFIFPQDYEYSPQLGFGLKGLGWYFPINDFIDITLTGDIYTRGTHGLRVNSRYRKRYKYSGQFNLGYANFRTENASDGTVSPSRSYSFTLRHNQDVKAHPYQKIGGSIHVETSNYQRRVSNTAEDVLENTYSSNFDYSHELPGSAYRFVAGFRHSQNTRSHIIDITLPSVSMKMQRIFPFKRKNKGGNKEAWFEKISFKHDFDFKNSISTTDSTLFQQESLDNLNTGAQHKIALSSSSFRLFKYFNLTPSLSYDEIWMFKQLNKREGVETVERALFIDTLTNDTIYEQVDSFFVIDETLNKFTVYRNFRAGLNLNTKIFGTKTFKKGWLRGVRHIMDPSIGLSIAPDTREIWTDTLNTSTNSDGFLTYSRLQNRPFNASLGNQQMSMTYSIKNQLEFKYFSKKDSTIKKFKLFDNLNIAGQRNFIADSLQWSFVRMNATSRFFKNISTLNVTATYDPYYEDDTGKRRAVSYLEETGKFLRLDQFRIKLSNRISIKQLKEILVGKEPERTKTKEENRQERAEKDLAEEEEKELNPAKKKKKKKEEIGLIDWLGNIRINHEYEYRLDTKGDEKLPNFIHTLNFSGSINITDKWKLTIGNFGYDFINDKLTYPAFNFSRELHCWDMLFSWQPQRGTYSFFIGVRNNSLNFLKYNYGQNNIDAAFGNFIN